MREARIKPQRMWAVVSPRGSVIAVRSWRAFAAALADHDDRIVPVLVTPTEDESDA